MPEAKRAFVSDIHMGGEYKPNEHKGYDWNWLSEEDADNFALFLEHVGSCEKYKELVILGDFLDDWVWPVDFLPPTFAEIVRASKNSMAVKALRQLCAEKKVQVTYLPGNHDMTITKEFLDKEFPGIVFGGSGKNDSVFRTGRLRAEHGSAHAMFNAPDPYNNAGSRLPLGYFISRVVATKKHRTNSGGRKLETYVDDLFEMLGPQTLASSVFEAVLEEAKLPETTEIKIRLVDGTEGVITGTEVKAKYANLYDQWCQGRGTGKALKAIMAELGLLGRTADSLCKKSDTNVVIFGHSHDWEIDKDSWLVDDRVYANCGAWCDTSKPHTFVETEKDEGAKAHIVRVKEWKGGKAELLKDGEEEVSL